MLKRLTYFCLTLLLSIPQLAVKAQDIFADSTTNSTAGLCLACAVTDPENAVDGDASTFSSIDVSLSLLGGTAEQTLIFPVVGEPGDTLELLLNTNANFGADVSLLGSILVETLLADDPNGDQQSVANSSLNLLSNNQFILRMNPQDAYDRIRVTVEGGLAGVAKSAGIAYGKIINRADRGFVACTLGDAASSVADCPTMQCEVSNEDAVITPNENDFARLQISAGIAGARVGVGAIFNTPACQNDSVEILVERPGTLIDLSFAETVTFLAFLDGAQVFSEELQTSNLGLVGTGEVYRYNLTPNTEFDSIAVELESPALGVNSTLRVYNFCLRRTLPPAPDPGVGPVTTACFQDSVCANFTVDPGFDINVYTDRDRNNLVYSGPNPFCTGALTQDTIFYVEQSNPNSGCVSSQLDSLIIGVFPQIEPAVPQDLKNCFNTSARIAPQPAGSTFNFYLDAAGDSLLFTGGAFITGPITSDTTFFVSNTVGGGQCVEDTTHAIRVLLSDEPVEADVIDTIGVCIDPVTMQPVDPFITVRVESEFPSGLGTIYRVYDNDQNLINVAGSPAEFTFGDSVRIPVGQFAVNGEGFVDSIFVDAVSGDCFESGNKQRIVLQGVIPTDEAPVVSDAFVCDNDSATLTVENPDPQLYYYWYDKATGGNVQFTGVSVTVPAGNQRDTLFVEGSYGIPGSSCTAPFRDTVVITPLTAVGSPLSNLNVTTCADSTATFDLTMLGLGDGDISWYNQPQGGFPVFVGDSFVTDFNSARDTFYVELADVQCATRFLATVDTTTPPSVNVMDALKYACDDDKVMLTASSSDANAQFVWSDNPVFGAGTVLSEDNPFDYQTSFANATDIENVYVHAIVDQCRGTSKFQVRVENVSSRQQPVVSPADTAVCDGQSVTFSVQPQLNQGQVSYTWWDAPNGGNQIGSGVNYSPGTLNSSNAYYAQIEFKDNNVCQPRLRTEATVDVLPRLSTPVLDRDCDSDLNEITFNWNTVTGATSYDIVINITVTDDNGNSTTTTRTEVAGAGATSFLVDNLQPNSIVEFNIRALGQLPCQTSASAFKTCISNICGLDNLAPQQAFYQACENEPVVVGITDVPSNATVSVNGQPATDQGSGNYTFTVNAVDIPGNLEVTQTVVFVVDVPAQGCDPVNIPVVIRVSPSPEGEISVVALDPSVIGGRIDEYQFIADFVGGDKVWAWDFGDGNTSSEKNPVHEYELDGTYTVTLQVNEVGAGEFACPASDTLQVVVTSIPDLFVPNTFTPNGDGANDEWRVFGRNLSNDGYVARIFNSYGNVVFETTDLDEAWDGTFEGEPAKMGAYYYTVIVFDAIGQKLEREGTLNLIRK